jgi:hypothetical protein
MLVYLYAIVLYYLRFSNLNYTSIIKKLPKYILISVAFKFFFFIFLSILNICDINALYFKILIWILIFNNVLISKNKREYVIIIILLVGFWFIVGYIFSEIFTGFPSFLLFFAFNYDDSLSLDCSSNDYYSHKLLSLNSEKWIFKEYSSIFYPLKNWFKGINLVEGKEYDRIGEVHKVNGYAEKLSKDLDGLEDNSYKPFVNYTGNEEVFENAESKKLIRSELIKKFRLQGGLFNITRPNLSIGYQLDTVLDNLVKYEAERLKFLNIIDNIEKGQELFYDPEARTLFIQYLDLLPHLIEDLRLREVTLLSNLPALPEQTQEEIDSLSPQGVALPEQTKEEIAALSKQDDQMPVSPSEKSLEAEDFMEDALKNLGMFSDKD